MKQKYSSYYVPIKEAANVKKQQHDFAPKMWQYPYHIYMVI